MDVRAARGDDRMLRRIIALLVSLAVLAERAAARSLAVRLFVLWLLRRAEAKARDLVLEETGLPVLNVEGFPAVGDGPADALALAARLGALAALLAALLPDLFLPGRRPAWREPAPGHAAQRIRGRRLRGWRPAPFDTS